MAFCNFTQLISPNECLGDSLATINANFSSLNEFVCEIPFLQDSYNTDYKSTISEQGVVFERIEPLNSFEYKTVFETWNQKVTPVEIPLFDDLNSTIKTYQFPYETILESKPFATFTSLALTNQKPKVTLFWTASGSDDTTLYHTNRALSPLNKGPIWFNGPITAVYQRGSQNFVYVGGEFTQVGGQDARKLVRIRLNDGALDPILGSTGTFNPGSPSNRPLGLTELGTEGTINDILIHQLGNQEYLIVGGSFKSSTKGRGLCIKNLTNPSSSFEYPFYVNGNVTSLHIKGNYLYVGGVFNYINYDANSATQVSGLRVNTKGIIRLDLNRVANGQPDLALDRVFAEKINKLFLGTAEIHSIASWNNDIFLGGSFKVSRNGQILAQNVIAINEQGNRNEQWSPIVNGPVYKLLVDETLVNANLYIGGQFSRYFTNSQFYSAPRINESFTYFHNALAIILDGNTLPYSVDTAWKPVFNDAVTSFTLHDNTDSTYIYCYGKFTNVNNIPASYLVALDKAFNSSVDGSEVKWNIYLDKSPNLNNNGLLRISNSIQTGGPSILIGGSFTKVNNQFRYSLARINGVEESIFPPSLSAIVWDLGVQVLNPGQSIGFNNTLTTRVSSAPAPYGIINATSFSIDNEIFKNVEKGQLYKFFIRRPGFSTLGAFDLPQTNDVFRLPVNVIGWKIDYNS